VTTIRQLVPFAFVMTLVASALLALVWSPLLAVGAAALVAHLVLGISVAAGALKVRRLNWQTAVRVPHTLLAGHISYGVGYLVGLITQLNLRKEKTNGRTAQ
jgi:predicted ABC-type exoprotein transport system permease subunit